MTYLPFKHRWSAVDIWLGSDNRWVAVLRDCPLIWAKGERGRGPDTAIQLLEFQVKNQHDS